MERKENRESKENVTNGLNESPVKNTIEDLGAVRYNLTNLENKREEEMQEFLRAISVALLSYSHKTKEENKND